MTVYVDQANLPYGRMIMCHMVATDLEELHQMADKIGVSRRHFQKHRFHPHYDICLAKKKLAIQFGAVELGNFKMFYASDPHHGLNGLQAAIVAFDGLSSVVQLPDDQGSRQARKQSGDQDGGLSGETREGDHDAVVCEGRRGVSDGDG